MYGPFPSPAWRGGTWSIFGDWAAALTSGTETAVMNANNPDSRIDLLPFAAMNAEQQRHS